MSEGGTRTSHSRLPEDPSINQRVIAAPSGENGETLDGETAIEIRFPRVVGTVTQGHIVIIDDELAVRDVCCEMLISSGYQAFGTSTGVAALEFAKASALPPAAFIFDVSVADLDGWRTFHEFRRSFSATPVVLTSGYSFEPATYRIPVDHKTTFLQKPFGLKTLLLTLSHALNSSG